MKSSANNLSVWVNEHFVCVKVEGRANFTSSVDFKTLVNSLWEKGHHHFILDLTDCLLMDSTFLGVLAGMGLRFAKDGNAAKENHAPKETGFAKDSSPIELLNPNARIADLLENLGVAHLFHTVNAPTPAKEGDLVPVEQPTSQATKTEISRTCLEAHRTLMQINPNNIPKFKDVTQFLAEDLKKMEGSGQ